METERRERITPDFTAAELIHFCRRFLASLSSPLPRSPRSFPPPAPPALSLPRPPSSMYLEDKERKNYCTWLVFTVCCSPPTPPPASSTFITPPPIILSFTPRKREKQPINVFSFHRHPFFFCCPSAFAPSSTCLHTNRLARVHATNNCASRGSQCGSCFFFFCCSSARTQSARLIEEILR